MPAEPTRVTTVIAVLHQTAKLMVEEVAAGLNAAGYRDITPAHHAVFENVDREGTRLTVLAARTGMTHQSMGELVAALEERGYLERRGDPSDRRARLVALTPSGRRVARRALREMQALEADWTASVNRNGCAGDVRVALERALRERRGDGAASGDPA